MCALLAVTVSAMVSQPGAVEVTPISSGNPGTVLELRTAKQDIGKVIGKKGRTARSLRTFRLAIAKEHGAGQYSLNIADAPAGTLQRED
jgi:hypothetical protein